jgi:Carboxypeptidase regulatory-like domain
MRSQRGSRVTSVSASRQGRRWPSALCLLAISVSILVAALLLGVVAPPPAQAAGTGSITGTVTNTSNVGLGGVWVAAYRSDGSGGWDQVNQTPTAASGSYNLGGLPTGSYRIEFEDDSGAYVTQYYNNKPTKDLGNDVAVTAGATTADINATLVTLAAAGSITGTVTNTSNVGLGGIWVAAYRSNGSGGWDQVNQTPTAASGSYNLGGLPTGSYRIEFEPQPPSAYLIQYYDGQSTIESADPVAVTVGQTTPNIDAVLISAAAPTVTLKLSGLTSGAMRLGKSVTAKGKVTPTSLAGSKVKLTVQKKRSARWVAVKSVARTISASGAYIWKYKPTRRGAYRMRATIAKSAAHTAAKTKWLMFKVK